MRWLIAVAGLLLAVDCAHAQPDDNRGLAVPEKNPVAILAAPVPEGPPPVPRDIANINRTNNPDNKLDTSTPEATVRSFVWALNLGDIKSLSSCVKDGLSQEALEDFDRYLHRYQVNYNYLITDLHSYNGGKQAIVTLYLLNVKNLWNRDTEGSCERLRLELEKNSWKIVAPETATTLDAQPREDVLARYAMLATGTDVELMISPAMQQAMCQMNLKQVGLGIFQFVQDWNEKFDLHAEWQKQLEPYLKTTVVFTCPDSKDDKNSYSFNKELENRFQQDIDRPSETILVYEGKDKKIEFRHMNKTMTNILFADGHVKAYTKETLETAQRNGWVLWK